MLFVHGDGYDMGTGGAFDGAVFASYAKAVVVTINYRLGPFGKRRARARAREKITDDSRPRMNNNVVSDCLST